MRRSLMLATMVAAMAFAVGACSTTPDVKTLPNTASTPTPAASPTASPAASPTGSPVAADKKPDDNTNVKLAADDKKTSEVNTDADKTAKPAASPAK